MQPSVVQGQTVAKTTESPPLSSAVTSPSVQPRRQRQRDGNGWHKNSDATQERIDPLTVFSTKFMARSWREFTACPETLPNASKTLSMNYRIISVCDKEIGEDKQYVLVHYRDTIEEEIKAQSGAPKPFWHIKGCIFDARTGILLARGFSFTPTVSLHEQDFVRILDNLAPRTLVREWREGDVVKVWTDPKGVVRVSKTRRINALRSKRDSCPSIEEMLASVNVDLGRLRAGSATVPLGTVFVLLLVHPANQIQNPDRVEPSVYHLDTWCRVADAQNPTNTGRGKGPARMPDSLFSLRRREVDVGLPRLPSLTYVQAIEAFKSNKSIYVQQTVDFGTIYRSFALSARYAIRGEREHLYHRYVELGKDGKKLLDCVPFAVKDSCMEFPTRFATDMEMLLSYIEGLFEPNPRLPPADSSLEALYRSISQMQGTQSIREKTQQLLSTCPTVVLYNMITRLKNKFQKRDQTDGNSSNHSIGESPSPPPS